MRTSPMPVMTHLQMTPEVPPPGTPEDPDETPDMDAPGSEDDADEMQLAEIELGRAADEGMTESPDAPSADGLTHPGFEEG